MNWISDEGQKLLAEAFPKRFLKRKGLMTVGGWEVRTGRGRASCTKFDGSWNEQVDSGSQRWGSLREQGALFPDPTHPETFLMLISEAMTRLEERETREAASLVLWALMGHEDRAWALVLALADVGGVEK